MKRLLGQLLGYGIASAAALALDLAILWALVRYCGWNELLASVASFIGGTSVAYGISLKLAFQQHRLRDRRLEFLSFVAIGMFGLAINSLVMSVAIKFFALHYLVARCVAAGFTFICNFFARRQLLFNRGTVASPDKVI